MGACSGVPMSPYLLRRPPVRSSEPGEQTPMVTTAVRQEFVQLVTLAMQCSDLIHEKLQETRPMMAAATATAEVHRARVVQLEATSASVTAFVAWARDWMLRNDDSQLNTVELDELLQQRRQRFRALARELTAKD